MPASPTEAVCARLFALQDGKYRAFQCRLMPTVPPDAVLGVRMPALRRVAKELAGSPQADAFLQVLPHRYYDENNLHGLLLAQSKDYGQTVQALEAFLPYVDNWATCDLLRPRAFLSHPPALPEQCRRWLDSGAVYTVRFAMGTLLNLYLDDFFRPEYLQWVSAVQSEEYYVNMMIAWYFATALAKQYAAALPYLQNHVLPRWVHNKTIQKAVESRRIPEDRKTYLRTLKER